MFIIVFTKASNWSLSWPRWIQYTHFQNYFFHSNIILASKPRSSEWSPYRIEQSLSVEMWKRS